MFRFRQLVIPMLLLVSLFVVSGCAAHKAQKLQESAQIKLKAEDYPAAEADLRLALSYEDSPQTHAQLGHVLAVQDKCLDALRHLPRGLKAEEYALQSRVDLARCHASLGSSADAAERYIQAIEMAPASHDLPVETAPLWPKLAKDARLLSWLERMIAAQPDKHYGWAYKGNYYFDLKDYPQAKDAYQKALDIFPHSAVLLVRLASAEALLNDWKPAQTHYEAALVLEPRSVAANYGIAALFARQRNYDRALAHLAVVFEADPENGYANTLAAQIYDLRGKQEKAIEHAQLAFKALPDNLPLGLLLLRLALTADTLQLAESTQAELAPKATTSAEFQELSGNLFEKTGKAEQARQAYIRAINLDANRATAHLSLGKLLFEQKRYSPAVATLGEAVRLLPENVDAHLTLGLALFALGPNTFSVAETALAKALELDPENATALAHMAAIKIKNGRFREGMDDLERAIANGFADGAFLDHEAFNAVRYGPRFKAVKAKLEAKAALPAPAIEEPPLVPLAPLPTP